MNHLIINGKKINTLYALSSEEHQKGLMEQQWPPPVMTFIFKEANIHKFWMKNTPSPLDIIFCNAGKVVSIEKGVPHSLKFVGPNSKTDMVIEMPRGTASSIGLNVGDMVYAKFDLDTIIRRATLDA